MRAGALDITPKGSRVTKDKARFYKASLRLRLYHLLKERYTATAQTWREFDAACKRAARDAGV